MLVNESEYSAHIKKLRLNYTVKELESIHRDERDFHSYVVIEEGGKKYRHTVGYCDPPFSSYSKGHYEIWQLGECVDAR